MQEVAFTLANGMAYVQAALDAGPRRSTTSRPAWPSSSTATTTSSRRSRSSAPPGSMWARVMRERFGAQNPKSQTMRFHTQTGGVTLTAQQPLNNIVRVALQALRRGLRRHAVAAHQRLRRGARAARRERAAKIALRTQQIIAHESGAADTVDPFAGSYYVEALTDEIERRARGADRARSTSSAARSSAIAFIKNEIEESAFGYHERYRTEQDIVVGVNKYVEEDAEVEDILRVDPEAEREQVERLKAFKAEPRPGAGRPSASRSCARPPRGDENLLPPHPRRAQGPLLGRRGVRRDARGLRRVPARDLMQAVVSTPGGERWAELRELPAPEPGPDELLVEVHAAGINRGELTLVQMREDFRPGQEIAGRRRGRAAQGRARGRPRRLARLGGVRHRARAPHGPAPRRHRLRHAAALPMAGNTALNLIRLGGDLLGRNVTVTGASGGVGVIAVQLARLAGANVTAVSAVTEDVARRART